MDAESKPREREREDKLQESQRKRGTRGFGTAKIQQDLFYSAAWSKGRKRRRNFLVTRVPVPFSSQAILLSSKNIQATWARAILEMRSAHPSDDRLR